MATKVNWDWDALHAFNIGVNLREEMDEFTDEMEELITINANMMRRMRYDPSDIGQEIKRMRSEYREHAGEMIRNFMEEYLKK